LSKHTILWRRIDIVGHDACRISRAGNNWTIEGTAIFLEGSTPSRLNYHVICDERWQSNRGQVSGWVGNTQVQLTVERDENNRWTVNGARLPHLDGLIDLDLGFTPATNTNAIKRLNLKIGDKTETVAAWLDTSDWKFKPLVQSYERLSINSFEYQSPAHDYREKLRTDQFGFVVEYPKLWKAE
jgi:uncharacterized protein